MLQINKSDLQEVFSAALEEYESSMFHSRFNDERITSLKECYGSIHVKMESETIMNGRLAIRWYELRDRDGNLVMRFLLGLAAALFSISAKKFRESLLSKESVRGVITLKQRIFSMTTVPAMMIFLDKAESADTWFATVDNIETLTAYAVEDNSIEFKGYYSANPVAENLLPEFYNGDKEQIEESFANTETKELQDVASVVNGKGAKREDFAEHGIPYLRARDLKNGKIMTPELFVREENATQFSKQLIQEGDILLTKNFGQNKLALVTEEDCPAIASNALFIIRPFDVSEGYLYRYLTSKTGNDIFNKQLKRVQRGTVIAAVSLSDLKKIVIPLYDEETMKNLEEIDRLSYEDAVDTSRVLLKQMTSVDDSEQKVSESLKNAGWDNTLLVDEWIDLDSKTKWKADFTYRLRDGRKVIVEVKRDLSSVSQSWVKAMGIILNSANNDIFILTTGSYYEVHVSGIKQSLKLMRAPSIEEILTWEKEVR